MALSSLAQSLLRESNRTWNNGSREPTPVTYSFATSSVGFNNWSDAPALPITEAEKHSIRAALNAWDSVSGVRFIEIPDVADASTVGLRIRIADMAWSPFEGSSPRDGGNISINSDFAVDSMAPGTEGYEVLLLTIGYAIGLNSIDAGSWPDTAMAMYKAAHANVAGLRSADIEAIQQTYGTQQAEEAFPVRWSWDAGQAAIRHDGNDASQTINGTLGRDFIVGYGGNDQLNGNAGNDLIYGGSGVNTIAGGGGTDTMGLDAFRKQATISGPRLVSESWGSNQLSASGRVSAPGEQHDFSSIEVFAFADGRLVFDVNDPVAQVTRMYKTALGRLPDSVGRENWTEVLQHGTPLWKLAEGFLGSEEFRARFGQPDDAGFVTRAYQQGLGREPDAVGLAEWQALLGNGLSRAELLAGFSESNENRGLTSSTLSRGLWDADDQVAEIARLYGAVLGRAPDPSGLRSWKVAALHGMDMEEIANEFSRSAEFGLRYPGAGDAEFVTAVYQNALGRGMDPTGQAFWLNHLAQGMTRGEMVAGVSHSTEFLILSSGVTEGGITFA